jgi:hypothetical protein
MILNGIIVGTMMFIGYIGLWTKFPPYLMKVTILSPGTTDVLVTIGTMFLTSSISGSITGIIAGVWCGILSSIALGPGLSKVKQYIKSKTKENK